MKDNQQQQIGQAIYKMSESKRKQLFNHLLNEFRNSKVNIGTPNYMSGPGIAGMQQPSSNLSGSTPSTLKSQKKKSNSIDKKATSFNQGTELMKKPIPKKNGTHKKSKSYLTGSSNMQQDASLRDHSINSHQQQQLYYQQMIRKDLQQNNGSTLENSFGNMGSGGGIGISNKSYERILAETIEAQNLDMGGGTNYTQNQYYSNKGGAAKIKGNQQNPHNMTLQLSSKRGSGSVNVSQSRFANQNNYDSNQYQTNKSNHNSHKSLSSNSKYDLQQKKKSRGGASDQFQPSLNQRSKCESNRTSKKNSPNHSISSNKGTLNIREARTKPTSPERQYMLINSYKNMGKNQQQQYISGPSMANQREERKALNMLSNLGSQENSTQQFQNQQHSNNRRINNSDFVSIQQQAANKRKNFKNMFYSPKGGRDAITEPHSKFPSQAQTKEHSPAAKLANAKLMDLSQQFSATGSQHQQILPVSIVPTNLGGHHPKIRSQKPPTQLKGKGSALSNSSGGQIIYSTKDSNNNNQRKQNQEQEQPYSGNSFLEESYMKHLQNNMQYPRKDEVSFESSSNQFSQSGTPNNYKGGKMAPQVIKKVNIVGREIIGNNGQQSSIQMINMQSNSTIERKPKKVMVGGNQGNGASQLQGGIQYPHTTGMVSKHNSQAPSPTAQNFQRINNQKKQRFQSEAPSPVNQKAYQLNQPMQDSQLQKKRGISIGGHPSNTNFQLPISQDSIESLNHTKKLSNNALKLSSQNQQQFLFNQYVKTSKKPQRHFESNEGSLERTAMTKKFESTNPMGEPFFDQQHMKHSATEISPRTKEVNLIKSLIKECFTKYNKPPKTQIELYKIGKMLGKGAFGRVNLGLHRLTRRLVAIKAINMEFMKDESSKKKMSNEISILKALRHPNVVKLLETFDTDKHHLIVMELCPGGDLLNYVRKRRKLTESMAKFVFKQIMEGILYLHQNGVVHRDIKLDNILLDGHGFIKLADFGVSKKVVDGNELLLEQCGTPAYIAPEIVRELGYKGFPVDIWSAGVCLYAMLYGNVPFKANQMGDLNKMILDANIEYKDTVSEEARDLMQRMLQKNPKIRLTAEEVLEHCWFDEVDEQTNIFDEQELDLIKKEFTYVTQKAKLKELKQRKPDDLNTEFTEHSINSNENTLMKNNSSRSVILCPFNTQAGAQAKSIYEDIQDLLVDKDMAIRFNARVRECDRQYEKFNNQDFDNGVYHKYAYNQGKKPDGSVEPLKEEVIEKDEVKNKNLVRKGGVMNKKDALNYYLKIEEKIVAQVEDYGFPRPYILKVLNENVNNHCSTSYYLLCMDQNY